jgi:hypothetical protein
MAKFPTSAGTFAMQRTPSLIQCEILATDASGTYQIPIAAGTQIHKVAVCVTQAFARTGGDADATMTIGRSTGAADAYFTNAAIALGTPDTAPAVSALAPFIPATSQVSTGEYINVVFTKTNGTPTAGRILIFVELSNVINDGILSTASGLPFAANTY